jgi:hypothetical protein
VLMNPDDGFYAADLVQNDPWLRGDVIRMVSHGRADDAHMMSVYFPDLREVYLGPSGAVWSAAPVRKQRH